MAQKRTHYYYYYYSDSFAEAYLLNALLCRKALRAFEDSRLKITIVNMIIIIIFRFRFVLSSNFDQDPKKQKNRLVLIDICPNQHRTSRRL